MSKKINNNQEKKEVFLIFDYVVNLNYVKALKRSQQNK